MMVTKYLENFRTLSCTELFSEECLDALKFIQNKYGQVEANHVIYEINLNNPVRTLDFSYRVFEGIPAYPYWYEFDYEFYSQGNLSHGYFLDLSRDASLPPLLSKNEEIVCRVIGRGKFEILRQPLVNIEKFLADRGTRLSYIGNLDHRGYSESVRIEAAVKTHKKVIELLRELSYSGDISLVEDTISKLEPYTKGGSYLLSFDMFADRISDKIGIDVFPLFSLNEIEDLVNFLVDNKLCLHEKGQGLIKWSSDPLPEGILQQRITFIKNQFEKDKIVAVKAYLMQSNEFPFEFFVRRRRGKS